MPSTDATAAGLARGLYAYTGDAPVTWDRIIQSSDLYVGIKRVDDTDFVVWRGSTTDLDWIHNAETWLTDVAGLGPVHHGFNLGVRKAWLKISTLIGPKFVVVGHSRGAGQAQLCTGYAILDGKIPAALITFGTPRAGTQQLADLIKPVPQRAYRNIANGGTDPVTYIPFDIPGLAPFVHTGTFTDISISPGDADPWPWPMSLHHIQFYHQALTPAGGTMAFDSSFQALLGWEGGVSNNPHDDGGLTNHGVTQANYDTYRGKKGLPLQPVTKITLAEAEDLYQTEYWNATSCGAFNPGLANCLFDSDVNSGDRRGAQWLQQAVNQVSGKPDVAVDGAVGPLTIAAANALPVDKLIDAMLSIRLAFLHVARNKEGELLWDKFGHGWQDRINGVRVQSHKLADVEVSQTPIALPSQATIQPEKVKTMATPATVTVPVDVLKQAANVSQTQQKTSFSLGIVGTVLGLAGPLLASFEPSWAHIAIAAATAIAGLGVIATGFVNSLNLSASAEAVTNGFIESVMGAANEIIADFGGTPTPPSTPAQA